MTEKERYKLFATRNQTCKADIIEDISDTVASILKKAEKDPHHSYAFYMTLKKMIDEFKNEIDKLVLMDNLQDGWVYDWGVSYSGVELQLIHYTVYEGYEDDPRLEEIDQIFTIFSIPAKLLTVEEYAKINDVEVVTVRQWIRRGKIRTAQKFGNEWRIPALTDMPQRGYTSAHYRWKERFPALPKGLEYLNDYVEAWIQQDDDDKKQFCVNLYAEDNKSMIRKPDKVVECTAQEREKIELAIISHPNKVYTQNFQENICIDLMSVYSGEGTYEDD